MSANPDTSHHVEPSGRERANSEPSSRQRGPPLSVKEKIDESNLLICQRFPRRNRVRGSKVEWPCPRPSSLGNMLFPRFSEYFGPMLSRNFIGTIRDVVIDHDNRFGNPPLNAFEGTPDSSRVGPRNHADRNRERVGIASLYRKGAGRQHQANRLAERVFLLYRSELRDRCRSGLSGSPGKRVLGKTNRGFESLPVRFLLRTGCLTSQRGKTDGAGAGLRGRNPDRNQSSKNIPIPPVRPYYVPQSRDFEGLGGQGYLLTQRSLRARRGCFLLTFEYVAAVA